MYGNAAISSSVVKNWTSKIREPRSGRPKGTDDEKLQKPLDKDATQSKWELAGLLNIDNSAVLRLKLLGGLHVHF